MRISKQKILIQKDEIEENHKKLEEATSLIVHNEKMAVLGTIGASLAHELNSPLTAIYNSAERLKNIPAISDNGNIDLILRSGKRCINIIDKFLRPVRNISHQKTANPKDILEDWLDIYENDFHNYFIGLSLDVIDDINLKITYEELYQVLTNLLLNARDELNKNENINKNVIIRLYKRNSKGIIEIQDNGGGIDEETLKNIFKPLNTTKELGKGIGIGLWLTKQLIEKNNGYIEISTSSRGTLVEIELELAKLDEGVNYDQPKETDSYT